MDALNEGGREGSKAWALSVVPHFSLSCRVSPFLAWGDFHSHSRFVRSTISEEKWGTTRSLKFLGYQINEEPQAVRFLSRNLIS